jgi:hypothetical protein
MHQGIVHRIGIFVLFVFAAGCGAGPDLGFYSGTCANEFDRCDSHCSKLKDDRECVLTCRFNARRCERDQGTDRLVFASDRRSRIGGFKALLADFSGKQPLASEGVKLSFQGPVRFERKAHELDPGARLEVELTLPAKTRQAELALTHGPAGAGNRCFVSISLGETSVSTRYVPPRTKKNRLKWETWNLTPYLPKGGKDGQKRIRIVVENNAKLGSAEAYRLSGLEVYYRAFE